MNDDRDDFLFTFGSRTPEPTPTKDSWWPVIATIIAIAAFLGTVAAFIVTGR